MLEWLSTDIWMNEDLGVSVYSLVKLLVCYLCIVNCNLMRDDERWFCSARNDEVSKVSVVLLDVALACCEAQTLEECKY